MGTVTVEQLRRDLPDVLKRLSAGGPLTVTQDGRAVAELRPPAAGDGPPPRTGQRPIGLAKGQFKLPDDFDDPLPDDVFGGQNDSIAAAHSSIRR